MYNRKTIVLSVTALLLTFGTVVSAKTWTSKKDGGTWTRGFTNDGTYLFSKYTHPDTKHGASTKGVDTFPDWKRVCANPGCFAESMQQAFTEEDEKDKNDFAYHPNCAENHD